MIKNKIVKFCYWLLSKLDNDSNNKKVDLSYKYNKVPNKKIAIKNNYINLIDKEIYLFNIEKDIEPYMKICEKSYKEYNPDFNVHFISLKKEDFYKLNEVKSVIEQLKLTDDKLDENLHNIISLFRYKFIYTHGGIFCNLKTYCCKSFNSLLKYNNFIMCKYSQDYCNIEIDNCCFGVQKGYTSGLKNIIYPPINYLDDNYETLKMSFYNGKLNKNIIDNVVNTKLHQYIYNFSI